MPVPAPTGRAPSSSPWPLTDVRMDGRMHRRPGDAAFLRPAIRAERPGTGPPRPAPPLAAPRRRGRSSPCGPRARTARPRGQRPRLGAACSPRLYKGETENSCLDRARRGKQAGWRKWRAVGKESQALMRAHFVPKSPNPVGSERFSNLIYVTQPEKAQKEGRAVIGTPKI